MRIGPDLTITLAYGISILSLSGVDHTSVSVHSIIRFNPETKPTSVELLSTISFNWFRARSTYSANAIRKKIHQRQLD